VVGAEGTEAGGSILLGQQRSKKEETMVE